MRQPPQSRPDPAEWIKAIAERQDRHAFQSLFAFYAPRIKGMLMRTGAAAELAEDVAQEAMLAVWRKAPTFDATRATGAAWIFTIARNLRIDRLRGEKRSQAAAVYDIVGEAEEPDRPDVLLDAAERQARVRQAMQVLSVDQVRVVELSFFEGRAHGDIASQLNIPLGTVKSRLRLAMGRLRDLLGELS